MKWFQKTGDGKWIETDGPFSFFGAGGSCLEVIVIGAIFFFLVSYPDESFQFILNLFINWPLAFLSNPTVEHFLTSIFG
jgi:hypothetical protein